METKITCNANGFCSYRFQEGSLFGCKFYKICQYQAPLLATHSQEATVDEIAEVIQNNYENPASSINRTADELLTKFHITKRGER